MSDFKVGDTIYWFCNVFTGIQKLSGIINIIHIKDISIGSASINAIGNNDFILHKNGYNFLIDKERCYKSKQKCILAFARHLIEISDHVNTPNALDAFVTVEEFLDE